MKKIFNKKGMEMKELITWLIAISILLVIVMIIMINSKGLSVSKIFTFL